MCVSLGNHCKSVFFAIAEHRGEGQRVPTRRVIEHLVFGAQRVVRVCCFRILHGFGPVR